MLLHEQRHFYVAICHIISCYVALHRDMSWFGGCQNCANTFVLWCLTGDRTGSRVGSARSNQAHASLEDRANGLDRRPTNQRKPMEAISSSSTMKEAVLFG